MNDNYTSCAECGEEVHPLDVFPGPNNKGTSCLKCYAARMENAPMPTAEDIVRMWGGKVR